MSALVSVIVPTYQSSVTLEACLQSVRAQDYPSIELIVVDNHSSDGTLEIARKYADQVFTQGPERCAQRNFGVAQAKGEIVFIIDSDMKLTPSVVSSGAKSLLANTQVQAVIVPEESFGVGFWSQCKCLERSFYVGVDWMEAARMFRRSTYLEMGGYDEKIIGGDDYDLSQRVEARFGRSALVRIPEYILHNEQKLSLIRTCRKKFYYAKDLIHYQNKEANAGRFAQQASLLARYALFFSQPVRLFRHPLYGLGMLFMKTSEFVAGGVGFFLGRLRG